MESKSLCSGLWMVGTLGLSLVLVALTQLCGGQVDAWIMPAAFLLAGAGVFLLSGGSDAAAAKSIARRSWFVAGCLLVQVAVWGVALWLAGCTYDYSVDGVSYHQDAVYAFFRGCNFYLHPTECGDVTLWTRHYAKGMEMMQACVMAMTGNIESGRAVNLMLATATGLLLWHASGRLGSQLSAKNGRWWWVWRWPTRSSCARRLPFTSTLRPISISSSLSARPGGWCGARVGRCGCRRWC